MRERGKGWEALASEIQKATLDACEKEEKRRLTSKVFELADALFLF